MTRVAQVGAGSGCGCQWGGQVGCVFLRVGGVFLRHLERGRGAQPLLSCLAHPAHPWGSSRWQTGLGHGPHLPVALGPAQGVWGHLSPCCCHFLCHSHSREGNGQERVIGASCRGNEVASGQPAALIHILACSCGAPGFPPNSLGQGGCTPSLSRLEWEPWLLERTGGSFCACVQRSACPDALLCL